ncbi:MAG: hypothetical protein AAGF98_20260, partial [Cyanobacteria bacterium P01_H01_bin.153]
MYRQTVLLEHIKPVQILDSEIISLTPEAFTTEPFEGRCPQNCDALMLSLSLAYRLDPDRVVTV